MIPPVYQEWHSRVRETRRASFIKSARLIDQRVRQELDAIAWKIIDTREALFDYFGDVVD